ncbi:MAG: ABC transporter permease [Muribaculaceae bacterium]|nr:ABC transporter permease [Muribaculaceae bacterium]
MFVRRNLVALYKHTVLGPFWYVLQSLLTILIYMFIFGGLAGLGTEGVPKPLFYMSGILMWNYFNDCFSATNNFLVTNANLFGKVYFPRLVLPISSALSSLGRMSVQFMLFLVIYFWCISIDAAIYPNWTLLLFPVYFVMLALFGISWGLLVTSFTYKYRDLQILITYFLQLLMYATPIVYPLEVIPEKYRLFISLNPLSPLFDAFKYGWLGTSNFSWLSLGYSFLCMMVFLIVSLLIFNRVEQNYMDTV